MTSLKFGTSGLRGLVRDMPPDVCARYVDAFLRHIETGGAPASRMLLVGRDLRQSSPAIVDACLAAAGAAGYAALDCGVLPTPALALEAMRLGVPAIMVTGSHIPADRNGLKFYRPDGEIAKADEAGILACLDAARRDPVEDGPILPAAAPPEAGGLALENYRRRYRAPGGAFPLAGMRVGVWQHSSVARDLIAEVLAGLGAEAVVLGRSDTFVAVDTEALGPEDAGRAAGWARAHRVDAIVSSDGDADRPLIADEQGRFLRGDVVGLLTALALGADTVVTPVTSSSAVELSGLFGRTVRTRVGSPYVIEAMAADGAGVVVGFEANGGVLLGSPVEAQGFALAALPTRDALLPVVAVLALARRRGRTVSQLVGELPARFTASGRIEHVAAGESAALLTTLADRRAAAAFLGDDAELAGIDTMDGVRLTLATGETVHFRASGNAPELRCYCEASTAARASLLLEEGLARASAAIAALRAGG